MEKNQVVTQDQIDEMKKALSHTRKHWDADKEDFSRDKLFDIAETLLDISQGLVGVIEELSNQSDQED